MKRYKIFLVLAAAAMLLASCGGKASKEPQTLRIAVLPILDAFPLYVAQEQGYFAEQNLDVELVPVNSGPERDQLMQAGQIDGMINEIVSTLFYNQTDTEVVIVRFARTATSDSPVFSILASADSGINSVQDLAGVGIGVSQGTVIEYMTDRVLENAGLSPDEIVKVAVPRIPDRLALLQSGELEAATLPDPVASLAILNGAKLIIDDSSLPEVGTSVYSFSVSSLEEKHDAVIAFLAALEKAVDDVNRDPTQFNDLLAELELVPPPLQATFTLPKYVTASVPTQAQWDDAAAWAMDAGLIDKKPAYVDSVDGSYLP